MDRKFVVLKFGGTSVATVERWQSIAVTVRTTLKQGYTPVLVCSALSGISNRLESLLDEAIRGTHGPVLTAIEEQHRELVDGMGLDGQWLDGAFEPLRRLAAGVALVGESTPRMRARVMATGELLSTRIGTEFLNSAGLNTQWVDARTCLRSESGVGDASFLSAMCTDEADPELQARFSTAEVSLTQGFIAQNPDGDTVLLGRGGSDTSAALFAARLSAERCEIWTDVPGIYTANPREIPDARMLRFVDYDEAQEIASAGASVLHPRCLGPVRTHGIPLHVRCTHRPELQGTIISSEAPATAEVKVIAARRGVHLISMSTMGMWQQSGFLADIFACFKHHGVSVDLISTSESNVTVSFDPTEGVVSVETTNALVADLEKLCAVKLIPGCAAVSLVGRHIRAILHQLGPALQVFESEKILLVSQAASDLNLTFVVEESQAERLVGKLHSLLFSDETSRLHLGPTWKETFVVDGDQEMAGPGAWWHTRSAELIDEARRGTPVYVYDSATIVGACRRLKSVSSVSRVFYAMKANDNPEILRCIADEGLGFECVSVGELQHLNAAVANLSGERILFTPNFAARAEYETAFEMGAWVTVDSLFPLTEWSEIFDGQNILLRLDPGRGRGHHAHVRTAGAQSKFGISPEVIEGAATAATEAGATVVGLHAHVGSGVRVPDAWIEVARFLTDMAVHFPDAKILDVGGGLGVLEKPGHSPLDLSLLDKRLTQLSKAFPGFELWMEPGRYVVAEGGVLLTRVNQTKEKSAMRYVGVDAGMHTFIRPALYGAWHEIVNLHRMTEEADWLCNVVGPICETGDTLGYGRRLPATHEGDVMLLATAGAYGQAMSSGYNRRPRAREVLLETAMPAAGES